MPNDEEVLELALAAGHVLLENGAEIFRVQETMDRICRHYGVRSGSEFILTNGIFVTAGDRNERMFAKVRHIPVSGTHLDKVTAVNQLSREISEGKYTVTEALAQVEAIRTMPEKKPWTFVLAAGVGSAAFCCLFGGSFRDCTVSLAAGLLMYIYVLAVGTPYLSKIVRNISAGALATVLCCLAFLLRLGEHLNFMIIGAVMPLVPGVAFTNGIRDIADGDYLSGSVRMLDAMLVFFSVAAGVGLGIGFLELVTGGAPLWLFK